MGDVIVTDTNTPAAGNDQILIVRPFNGTPTPTSRLKPDTYYSFKNTWYKLFQPIYDLLKAYVPITRTITINGDTQDLSANRTFTVTAANYIDSVANTDTVTLDVTDAELTADVKYQDSADITITKDASGLKAEFASHDVSQFTNDADYFVNGGALDNGTTATTQAATDNSTKVATTAYVNNFFSADNFRRVFTDLTGFGTNISSNTDIGADWRITVGNTGSTTRDTVAYSNALGVLNFLTNANGAGRVCMYSFGWYLGSKITHHRSQFKIPVLATSAQNFYCGIGLIDNTQFSAATNGVMVYCVNGTNSGNWVIQTMTASVSTVFNTSVTPVADTFTTLEIQVNAAGTEVRVFFDGVEPSGAGYPLTTNIPAGLATQLFAAVCIEKSNGTTSRTLSVDYIDSHQY